MSAIVTSILSSTVGLLFNTARDMTAERLRDSDVGVAQIREIVTRDLTAIRSTLDGISRKDLLSSNVYLQEGVDILIEALDILDDESIDALHGRGGRGGRISRPRFGISRFQKVYRQYDKRIKTAKERFADARRKATEAFCNEALIITDRIFAAKLRVLSGILECIDDPESAITGCLSFLEKLHELPAICEIFSVFLNGGMMSFLNKAERVEIVKSVMLINYVLYQLNVKFSRKFTNRVIWPGKIKHRDGKFINLIQDWNKISTMQDLENELMQAPNRQTLDLAVDPDPSLSAVNSHGDIAVNWYDQGIRIIPKTGTLSDFPLVTLPKSGDDKDAVRRIVGVAVDKRDNIYVVLLKRCRGYRGNVYGSCILYVLDPVTFEWQLKCQLYFLHVKVSLRLMRISISQDNDIIMVIPDDSYCTGDGPYVYICNNNGTLMNKFKREYSQLNSLCIIDTNKIMIESNDGELYVCLNYKSQRGLDGAFLRLETNVPAGHKVQSIAYHYITCQTVVLTFVEKEHSYFLLCFNADMKLESTTFFCRDDDEEKCSLSVTSHPSGQFAVVGKKNITYI